MADIFISYAHADRESARLLAERFATRGWSVWWDPRLLPGQDSNQHIQAQLDTARCVVVLWSKISIASQYVRDEAAEGLSSNRLVPVLIEEVKPPLGFRQHQTANLVEWTSRNSADDIATLFDAVGALVPLKSERQPRDSTAGFDSQSRLQTSVVPGLWLRQHWRGATISTTLALALGSSLLLLPGRPLLDAEPSGASNAVSVRPVDVQPPSIDASLQPPVTAQSLPGPSTRASGDRIPSRDVANALRDGAPRSASEKSDRLVTSSKDPDFILRNFKTLLVDANGAKYFGSPQMKAALGRNKEFAALKVAIVDDPAVADVVLDVNYTFAWDFPFSLRHQSTSLVLLSGTGSGPFSGPRGATSVASELAKLLKPHRTMPAAPAAGKE